MNETDIGRLIERGQILEKIQKAGPTARELVDAFGAESLVVDTAEGEVQGYVDAEGKVMPRGPWRVKICRPEFSPGRNAIRHALFQEMCRKKVALQNEDMERRHDTTNHVLWKDADGDQRAAPEEAADRAIAKTGLQPMTHPKVWRPGA